MGLSIDKRIASEDPFASPLIVSPFFPSFQVLSVHHPQWGNLNLGLIINLAPGRLGQYTKIVYFCPRYVVWNRHSLGISVRWKLKLDLNLHE